MISGKLFPTVNSVEQALKDVGYFTDRRMACTIFLSLKLQRPILLEGHPGVGKTELAKALALILKRPLIRMQCYDGMEQREVLYEWNHTAQLIHMRAMQGQINPNQLEKDIYADRFLIKRPLLQALKTASPGAVLLIDEVDRADEPFEAFLLEYLGEFQVTIPEMGTIKSEAEPVTILTSNRTRELHDAIKRRCLYHWTDYPDSKRELEILKSQVPEASDKLTKMAINFVAKLRSKAFAPGFSRLPGIAETVEWAKALVCLNVDEFEMNILGETAGILFKTREDIIFLNSLIPQILAEKDHHA